MSTSSYRLLVVLLLCVSFRLCDARRLRPTQKKLETSYNRFSPKNGEENGKAEAPSKEKTTVSSSSTKALEGPRTEAGDDQSKPQSVHAKVAGDDEVSRSLKVPQKNRPREEHPSFNLDYMQPVTHPPHHN